MRFVIIRGNQKRDVEWDGCRAVENLIFAEQLLRQLTH
jgi:hypothetical protein